MGEEHAVSEAVYCLNGDHKYVLPVLFLKYESSIDTLTDSSCCVALHILSYHIRCPVSLLHSVPTLRTPILDCGCKSQFTY